MEPAKEAVEILEFKWQHCKSCGHWGWTEENVVSCVCPKCGKPLEDGLPPIK